MRVSLIIILFFTSLLLHAQTAANIYIEKYDSLAIEIFKKYDIPASLVLGVAMHESGAGTSKLCRVNHNHFGVKTRVKTQSGYVTKYRTFESDEAAYQHFGEMISKKKYYLTLKGNMDYMKWLKAMKSARYATSSTWISQVDHMIKRYTLTRFDSVDLFPLLPAPATADSVIIRE